MINHRLVSASAARLIIFVPLCAVLHAAPQSVSEDQAAAWIRYTVPLPKQIEIKAKAVVPATAIQIVEARSEALLARQATVELRQHLGLRADAPQPPTPAFALLLQIPDVKPPELQALKNAEQAYQIIPDKAGSSLRLVALTPRGLYYAAKTLQQLLKVRADGQVEIPLARVTDWPDLEKRGLWGSDCYAHLCWMGDRKMNIAEQISDHGIDAQGKPYARLKGGREPMVTEGPGCGVDPVPVVLHLEQLSGRGIFQAHPELKAQGGQEGAICYSKPQFVPILAEWLVQLGSLPGVSEVDVWMAENMHGKGGCQCADCRKEDRSVLEARTVVAAWKKARARLPDLTIYVLTSEETESANARILKELPSGVKLWYYHSLLTYNSAKTGMLRRYLPEAAKTGQWVGVCPNVTAFVNFPHPFTGADFIHFRMNEFVDKGMSGLIGYATPRVHFSLFNVEAAAEWTWNAKGRSPREFALSWAVRQGMKAPKRFAEWSEALGPVAWDVYGSDWPSGEMRSTPAPVAERLGKGELGDLGTNLWGVYRSPWGDIKTLEQLDKDVAQADRALGLARDLGQEAFVQESLVVQGYIHSLKALYELRALLKAGGKLPAEKRTQALSYFKQYDDSLKQAADALPKWEDTVHRPGDPRRMTAKPVEVIAEARQQMAKLQRDLGL